MERCKLSPKEKSKLAELYSDITNAELAVSFGVTEAYISHIAFRMRLFKSEDFHRIKRAKGQFKPGNLPPNAGKKLDEYMSPEAKSSFSRTLLVLAIDLKMPYV